VDCSNLSESCFVDVVEQLFELEEGRLGVGFRRHAAIYFLSEDHTCFVEWRELVKESEEAEKPVRVLFRVVDQEVIGLDPGATEAPAPDPEVIAEGKQHLIE
jgi:hypothetical protein